MIIVSLRQMSGMVDKESEKSGRKLAIKMLFSDCQSNRTLEFSFQESPPDLNISSLHVLHILPLALDYQPNYWCGARRTVLPCMSVKCLQTIKPSPPPWAWIVQRCIWWLFFHRQESPESGRKTACSSDVAVCKCVTGCKNVCGLVGAGVCKPFPPPPEKNKFGGT